MFIARDNVTGETLKFRGAFVYRHIGQSIYQPRKALWARLDPTEDAQLLADLNRRGFIWRGYQAALSVTRRNPFAETFRKGA